jgi:hypothetical protein
VVDKTAGEEEAENKISSVVEEGGVFEKTKNRNYQQHDVKKYRSI